MTAPSYELNLSFAADLPVWQQKVVNVIEHGIGKNHLVKTYRTLIDKNQGPESFWDDVIDTLGLKISTLGKGFEGIPATGPLVIIANHPFGMMDGASICWMVSQIRKDFKVVLWDVFEQQNHGRNYFLPLDLAEDSKEARRQNLKVRRDAVDYLRDGHIVIIFPSGSAERPSSIFGRPYEMPWHRFTEKMITASQAAVLPIFVHGHNSRLFHMASCVSEVMRRAMFIREIKRAIGTEVTLSLGDVIMPEQVKAWLTRRENIMDQLRQATFALSDQYSPDQKQILWPSTYGSGEIPKTAKT